jgi:hypothetical protein
MAHLSPFGSILGFAITEKLEVLLFCSASYAETVFYLNL